MRRWTLIMAAFAASLGLVGLANAQRQGGAGGFGGGLQRTDPVTLLNNASVKKELEITDEQVEKLPDAVRKALADILTEKQLKRLKQIELQQKGINGMLDASVVSTLKLSEEQQGNIKTIVQDAAKEMKEAFGGGAARGGAGGGGLEKIQNMQKETFEKAQDVLTSEQKRSWTQLVGETFKMERPAFGGGAGGFGGKGKIAPPKE